MDSPVIYIFYHLIKYCRLNVRFNMQSCVHSFYYFFLLDRPTHLLESEGDGKRNILLGWPKGHVNFASHNCLFTSSVLQGKGKNGEKQRQSASDASRIDPSYLSARVQFSRLYPHRGAWSQATLFGTLFGLSRVLTTLDQIRSHFSIRKFWVSFFPQK